MAFEIPTSVPAELNSGDLIKWKIPESDDFAIADGWALSYALVKAGKNIEIVTSDAGDNHHLVNISAADSAKWPAGDYKYYAYVTLGTDRHKVDEGSITINPNYAALEGGYDARSHWKIVLENVEAVIQGRATRDQSSYTINGRQLSRTPIADLIMLYNKAKSAVAGEERAERIANGLGNNGKIQLRF